KSRVTASPGVPGRPRLRISARMAHLPPRRLRMSALPSALPSPNAYTHFAMSKSYIVMADIPATISFIPSSASRVRAAKRPLDVLLSPSPLDFREIRHLVQRRTQGGQKIQPVLTNLLVVGVHFNAIKECIHRNAQSRHLLHGRGKIFFLQQRRDGCFCLDECRE